MSIGVENMDISALLNESFEINNRYENFIKNAIKKSYIVNDIDISKDSNEKELKQIVDICIKDQKETLFFLIYMENKKIEELKKLNLKFYEDWNDGAYFKTYRRILYEFTCFIWEDLPLEEKVKTFDRMFKAMVYGLNCNITSLTFAILNFVGDNLSPTENIKVNVV